MASFTGPFHLLLIVTFTFLHFHVISSFEFQVGGTIRWTVPPLNDTGIYNRWASQNRFQVGDAIFFYYKKDSVMEVKEDEYKNCNSSRPKFFSNNGHTVFRLHKPGSFYFISGVSGHCEKGQKMIIKVLTKDVEASQSQDSKCCRSSSGSNAPAFLSLALANLVLFQFVYSSGVDFVC